MQKYRRSSQVVLAGDVNCAVGSRISSAVGDCGAEWEDASGEWWHRVLREAEAYLPCTFWECQVGPTSTYVQKRGHRECRIDMVGIPAAWATGTVRAWVDPSIHVALASLDHTATCVSVDLWLTAPLRSPGKTRQRLKASTLCDPTHAAQIQAAVASIPPFPGKSLLMHMRLSLWGICRPRWAPFSRRQCHDRIMSTSPRELGGCSAPPFGGGAPCTG